MSESDTLSKVRNYLAAAGLTSASVAIVYVCGFLVHAGEASLLGVNIPAASTLEYLLLGGEFLFHSLQSMMYLLQSLPYLLLGRLTPVWLEGIHLFRYFLIGLAILSLPWGLRRISGTPWVARYKLLLFLTRRLQLFFILSTALFTLFWVRLLFTPFGYQNLLFPLNQEYVLQSSKLFEKQAAAIESAPSLSEPTRRKQKLLLLSRILREAIRYEDVSSGTAEEESRGVKGRITKIRMYREWQKADAQQRTSGFALFQLICLVSSAHLILAIRSLLVMERAENTDSFLHRGLRFSLVLLFGLCFGFQLCSLPLNFSIAAKNNEFLTGSLSASKLPELNDKNLILLGEHDGKMYLYSYSDLWTLHVVSSEHVEGFTIRGRESPFSWMNDVPLEIQVHE